MATLAKDGGYIINILPNGASPLRREIREKKLRGYNIPEIDYPPEFPLEEMKQSGLQETVVMGHNLFDYLLLKKSPSLPFRRLLYLALQAIPSSLLPDRIILKYAGALILIGRKK